MSTRATTPTGDLGHLVTENPSRRAKRGEGDKTRSAILEAAESLLIELGSEDAVNLRAVAERVGLTPAALYRYFPDKGSMMFEVCGSHFDTFNDEVIAPALKTSTEIEEALREIAEGYIRFGIANPEHYRIMFMGHADHTPDQYADEKVLERGSFASLGLLIQSGVDAGVLRDDLDVRSMSWALWSGVHGLVALLVAKPNMPGPPVEQRISTLIEVLINGARAH